MGNKGFCPLAKSNVEDALIIDRVRSGGDTVKLPPSIYHERLHAFAYVMDILIRRASMYQLDTISNRRVFWSPVYLGPEVEGTAA